MTVKFYLLQIDTDTGKTSEKYLYKKQHDLMMVGKQIEYLQVKYQVNSLEWINQPAGVLKAVCLEVPAVKK